MKSLSAKKLLLKTNPYLFLFPALFVLGLALVYPIAWGLKLSTYSWQLGMDWSQSVFVGLANFKELFTSQAFRDVVKVTATFTVSVVGAELVVGLFLALLLEEPIKGLTVFRTIFILPMMIAPVVVGLIWRFLYHPFYGHINYFLSLLGIPPQMWLSESNLALASIIIADVWQWTPFVFLLVLAGLQSMQADPLEAARIDGASYLQTLFYVKLPLLRPIIGVVLMLRLIDALKVLEVIFNMTDGGPGRSTTVWALQVYKTAFVAQRLGLASAYAVVLLIIQLILALLFIRFLRLNPD